MDPGPPYPYPPWRLHGDLYLSLWRADGRLLPRAATDLSPVTLGGQCWIQTVWAVYDSHGVMPYRELIASVVTRPRITWRGTIFAAWVDSEPSLLGGRALWRIPKQLAKFRLSSAPSFDMSMVQQGGGQSAAARFDTTRRLPGRWVLPTPRFVQDRASSPVPCRLTGRLRTGTITMTVSDDGPLALLHDRRPLASIAILDSTFTFGTDAEPTRHRRPDGADFISQDTEKP